MTNHLLRWLCLLILLLLKNSQSKKNGNHNNNEKGGWFHRATDKFLLKGSHEEKDEEQVMSRRRDPNRPFSNYPPSHSHLEVENHRRGMNVGSRSNGKNPGNENDRNRNHDDRRVMNDSLVSSKNKDKNYNDDEKRQEFGLGESEGVSHLPPPPPPPPPEFPFSSSSSTSSNEDYNPNTSYNNNHQHSNDYNGDYYVPPPPPPFDPNMYHPQSGYYGHSYAVDERGEGDQMMLMPEGDGRDMNYYFDNNHTSFVQISDGELQQLQSQLDNITQELTLARSLCDSRMDDIDVLTEKLADAESFAASESNAALEASANATKLAHKLANVTENFKRKEKECVQLRQQCEELDEVVLTVREDMESLACAVESSRLREAKLALDDRGFFQRFVDQLLFRDSSKSSNYENIKAARELSRQTLMDALQAERSHIEELEHALQTHHQNNTAISEMVKSRDELIEELNDRIQVFEEDKIVLKAALKQLQMEMREETPKTAKLHFEYNSAKTEIEMLNEEIALMSTDHEESLSELNDVIASKESELSEANEQLMTIGKYVDQLEDRLTLFKMKQMKELEYEKESKEKMEVLAKDERAKLENDLNLLKEEAIQMKEELEINKNKNNELLCELKSVKEELEMVSKNSISSVVKLEEGREKMVNEILHQPVGLQEYDDYEYDNDEDNESEVYDDPTINNYENDVINIANHDEVQNDGMEALPAAGEGNGWAFNAGASQITDTKSIDNSILTDDEDEDFKQMTADIDKPVNQPASASITNVISHQKKTSRSFRNIRKAFSKATGMHHFFSNRPGDNDLSVRRNVDRSGARPR